MAKGQRGKADARDHEVERLKKDIMRRDRVIGELIIANDILKEVALVPKVCRSTEY